MNLIRNDKTEQRRCKGVSIYLSNEWCCT